jgi:ABC-type transport system involved in cytochrome bd biosynthesis fused ATPase/permease subunit
MMMIMMVTMPVMLIMIMLVGGGNTKWDREETKEEMQQVQVLRNKEQFRITFILEVPFLHIP